MSLTPARAVVNNGSRNNARHTFFRTENDTNMSREGPQAKEHNEMIFCEWVTSAPKRIKTAGALQTLRGEMDSDGGGEQV